MRYLLKLPTVNMMIDNAVSTDMDMLVKLSTPTLVLTKNYRDFGKEAAQL